MASYRAKKADRSGREECCRWDAGIGGFVDGFPSYARLHVENLERERQPKPGAGGRVRGKGERNMLKMGI